MGNNENMISIELKNISEIGFTYLYDYDYDSVDEKLLEVGLELETKFVSEENLYNIDLDVSYKHNEDILSTLKVRFGFEIRPFDLIIDNEGNEIISRDLLLNLINIAVGTIRGVLFVKMQNTPLNKYILPIFHISLIENMIKSK